MSSITAIIVNYHTAALLPPLVTDLSQNQNMHTICIVDNSGEVDLSRLSAAAGQVAGVSTPVVNLIVPGKNIGFGAGVNLGVDQSSSDYILLVNPDVRVLPGCIDRLVDACKNYRAVITGPRFYWDDAKQFELPPSQGTSSWMEYALAVSDISRLDHTLLSFYWEMRHERFWAKKTPFAEPFLSGACLLIDRNWACQHNQRVMDERFFLYYEDNDICVRAMDEANPPLCVPAAEMVHYYNQSPDPDETKAQLMLGSLEKFRDKYYANVKWGLENTGSFFKEPVPVVMDNKFAWAPLQPVGRLYFEFGVNMQFIPFARTQLFADAGSHWPEQFQFPAKILDRLADGIYFCRLRDDIKGTLKIWKWQKTTR